MTTSDGLTRKVIDARAAILAAALAFSAVTPAAAPPLPTPYLTGGSGVTSIRAEWVGADADVVSNGSSVAPDGALDGHFRLDLVFDFWQDVSHISVYSSDAAGNPYGGQTWHTREPAYWVLGVLYNDLNLNAGHIGSLGKFNGTVSLDLYAGDSGWFAAGNTFVVDVGLGPTEGVTALVQIPAGGTPAPPPAVALPPTGGAAGPDGAAVWGMNPAEHRGKNGQQFAYSCPRGGAPGSLWGTDLYTDDSSICTAAVHAGHITFESGGVVIIEIRPGASAYTGSTRYGVASGDWQGYGGSFVFAGGGAPATVPGVAPPTVFAGTVRPDRDSYSEGEPITVTFDGFPATYDWIALAPAGAAPESYGEWHWTDGSTTSGQPAGSPQTSGSLSYAGLAPGSYEVRAYLDWPTGGHIIRTSYPFTVEAAQPPMDLTVGYDAAWIGMDGDLVGIGGNGTPDNVLDGHFALDLSISRPYEVRYIAVYSSDAQGNPSGGQIWHTQNSSYYVLGVMHGGYQQNTTHVGSLGTYQGSQRFELFANDTGWFQPGQSFVVEVDVGLGQPLRWMVQVTGGVAPPARGAELGGSDWSATADRFRGRIGEQFAYQCPPGGSAGRGPWGTGLYTDDSSVCTAAVHAGRITFESGGTVTIEIQGGQDSYPASQGYGGVTSAAYGAWGGSFVFVAQ